MNAPRIEIDLAKVEHNTRVLVGRLGARDVRVVGVTKATLGSPNIAAAMLRGGAIGLGDSRIENLARPVARPVAWPEPVARTLIRSPMLSQVSRVVEIATTSLNTEPTILAALDQAAIRAGTRHDVVLMVELGDLREGILADDVDAAVRFVRRCPALRLVGLGANLACQNGVVPDDTNMGVLSRLVETVEATHRTVLPIVSGGNSANVAWALSSTSLGRTNQLRLGESILLGTEPLHRTMISGLHGDAFTLVGEVIEAGVKPAQPWGQRGESAFGVLPSSAEPVAERGSVRQAIVALGRQDVDLEGLVPPSGFTVLGMSSDHLVLGTGDHVVVVGDEIRFGLGYGALVHAMTSPFVSKVEKQIGAR